MAESKYDWDAVGKLLDISTKVSQNYPNLRPISDAAMEELQQMVKDAEDPRPRIVTPPEGPANSAVDVGDGTIRRLAGDSPIPNATPGQREEGTGLPITGATTGVPVGEEAKALDNPTQPAPGVDPLTAEQNPSDTPEEIERKQKEADDRLRETLKESPRDRETVERQRAFSNPPSGQPVQPSFSRPSDNEIRREEINRTQGDQSKVPPPDNNQKLERL